MIARQVVLEGDDIVSLSARLLGDPLQWSVLTRLNNLRAPYIAPVPTPGCLSPGELILYPARDVPAVGLDAQTLESRSYKRDLRAEGGDLVLSEGQHFTLTVGMDNLSAALTRRLRTRLGRHPFHPLYGSLAPGLVGRPAAALIMQLAVSDLCRAVNRDPRVVSCTAEAAYTPDGKLEFTFDVVPIAPGEALRIVV